MNFDLLKIRFISSIQYGLIKFDVKVIFMTEILHLVFIFDHCPLIYFPMSKIHFLVILDIY